MGRILRLSDEELARLLAAEAPAGGEALEEVASLLSEARGAFSAAPDAATRALHIAAISDASHHLARSGQPVTEPVGPTPGASGLDTWRRVISLSRSLLLKGSAAALAASMSMVGLAYAGVDLPGSAAEQAIEAVLDVELPNQAGSGSGTEELTQDLGSEAQGPDEAAADVAREIWDYVSTTEDTGCAFGQNIAAIAAGTDQTSDDPCSAGATGRATGEAAAEEGQANNPTGQGAGSGDDAAEEGQANNPTGRGAGAAGDAAEEGQANNPTGRP